MRTWGRVWASGQPTNTQTLPASDETSTWVEVATNDSGNNDLVWLTTLAQCALLGLGESPFYGNFGIPAQQSSQTGVPPDFYVARLQQLFSPYFASLTLAKVSNSPPTYNIAVVTHAGVVLNTQVAAPV